MNLTQFSAEDLQRITDIVRKKEEHLRAASALDAELAQIGISGIPVAPKQRPRQTSPPVSYSSVREITLQALKDAGPAGKTTRELAQATNRLVPTTGTWLRSYIANYPENLSKQGDRWILSAGVEVSSKSKPRHSLPRGTAREVILAALSRAGEAGLTIPALEQQTGFNKAKINGEIYRSIKMGIPIRRMGAGLHVYIPPPPQ